MCRATRCAPRGEVSRGERSFWAAVWSGERGVHCLVLLRVRFSILFQPQVRRVPAGLHASRGRPRSGGSWRAAGRDGRTRWSSRSIVPACLSSTPRRGARAPGAGEPGQSVEGQLAEGALLSPDAAARSSRRKLRRAPARSQIPGTSRGDRGAEEVILLLRRLGQAFSR